MIFNIIKVIHIVSVISWMAGLLYLPRLFVYHAMSKDKISHERFIIMERKLFYGIMTPGALITLILGIWLWLEYDFNGTWFQLKLLCVILLIFYHIACLKYLIDFKLNKNKHSHIFYRWFNEIPVILLFAIVILAVVKPL